MSDMAAQSEELVVRAGQGVLKTSRRLVSPKTTQMDVFTISEIQAKHRERVSFYDVLSLDGNG